MLLILLDFQHTDQYIIFEVELFEALWKITVKTNLNLCHGKNTKIILKNIWGFNEKQGFNKNYW